MRAIFFDSGTSGTTGTKKKKKEINASGVSACSVWYYIERDRTALCAPSVGFREYWLIRIYGINLPSMVRRDVCAQQNPL